MTKEEERIILNQINSNIIKNFFGVCTVISSITLGFVIDRWIVQNVCSQLAAYSLLLKTITFIIIINYVCKDDHESLEEAITNIEEKLRSIIFEEVD